MPSDPVRVAEKVSSTVCFNPLLIGRCLQTLTLKEKKTTCGLFQPPTNREMPSDATADEFGLNPNEFQPPTNREMPSDAMAILGLKSTDYVSTPY